MEIIDKKIPYEKASDKIYIIGLGDIHLGHAGCDKEKVGEVIRYIKDTPNCYWIGMGDYAECINITDKRFDPKSIDPEFDIGDLSHLVSKQYDAVKELLYPIKDKCIAMLSGNHEETIRLKYSRDVGLDFARELGAKYLGYSGFIRLKLTRQQHHTVYLIYVHHGWGSARTSGAKVSRLESFAHGFNADVIMIAHEHKKIIAPPVTMLDVPLKGKKVLLERKRLAVMTGGFLRGYREGTESYVERKGYNPSDLGVVKVSLRCERKDIHASL